MINFSCTWLAKIGRINRGSQSYGGFMASGGPLAGDESRALAAWSIRSHRRSPDRYWCTPVDAARILGTSDQRVRRLMHGTSPAFPTVQASDGRWLLRRADVEWAAEHAGPPGDQDRWKRVREHLIGITARQPRRLTARAKQIAGLPWDKIAAEYRAGATAKMVGQKYGVAQATVLQRLRQRGIDLRTGREPATLPLSNAAIRRRVKAGATYAQLAAEMGVSVSTIWRRVEFG